jgi:aminoglycoside phosphotransferase family enzyme/predicted kinase
VAVIQTHISCVFLAGDQVFKVKKAVRFPFLDFSTLERRRHFCEEEVRLNRRLAPGVYLGVVPIVRAGARYRVGGAGEPIEYAVHMRRLPGERVLRHLVEHSRADTGLMERIAVKMAAFHAQAETGPEITAAGASTAIRHTLRENFVTLAPLAVSFAPPGMLVDLPLLMESALARIAGRLHARQEAGRVRDCHGDLRPDHICCTDELPIFDCIEFNPRFRYCDVASEMAFLAMELDFLGARPLADTLIEAYVATSGDAELPAVLPFFLAYRAQVRAMVAALTSTEEEIETRARVRAREDARRYLAIAERAAWAAHAPLLIAIVGPAGTGKSTLAGALAARTAFAWLRSDVVRKQRAGLATLDRPADAERAARLYAPERSAQVYAALTTEAEALARAGRGGILDATFQRRDDRDRLRAAAARSSAPLLWIECRAAPATVRERLLRRAALGSDPSDATWTVARAQARDFEPLAEVAPDTYLSLATDDGTDSVASAHAWLARRVGLAAADAPR